MPHRHQPRPAASGSEAENSSFPFAAMNLRVGSRMQAQPPAKVSSERFYVQLIGYVNDLSLLITTPVTSQNVRLQLIEGDALVMRVFVNQCAYGFACDVLRVCKLPYSYLHTTFPVSVQGTVIRKAPRVKTKIIAKIRHAGATSDLPGVLANLSASGALLNARHALAGHADMLELEFKLRVHNMETSLTLKALVRSVFTDPAIDQTSADLAHFGLEFVDLQPSDQMALHSMVYQQMIENPESLV